MPEGMTPKIFVVDDDSSVRAALSRLMESMGWQVKAYASALEFLEGDREVGLGCVILDVQMPEVTGPQLQELMLLHGIDLPVIFLTAHGTLPTGIRAMKQGAVDFLQKPVDEAALFAAVEQALERHRLQLHHRRQIHEIHELISRLSRREREVMRYVLDGRLNKQIADAMGISMTTVKKHRARVMEKMAVNSVAELVHLCDQAQVCA